MVQAARFGTSRAGSGAIRLRSPISSLLRDGPDNVGASLAPTPVPRGFPLPAWAGPIAAGPCCRCVPQQFGRSVSGPPPRGGGLLRQTADRSASPAPAAEYWSASRAPCKTRGWSIQDVHRGRRSAALPKRVQAAAIETFATVHLVFARVAFGHTGNFPNTGRLIRLDARTANLWTNSPLAANA